ncbi:MBL fold metallo-hydrolase [Candidatus Poribacteria bacterium]|nr:MBL fold metallo-hydrolase [Candidatus Poribacteria bacterium]
MRITSIGQSTFKLEIGGIVILTDPWFTTSGILYRLFMRRIYPLATDPESISHCDVMLVSHNHIDHFDRGALNLAHRLGTTVVGPASVVKRSRRNGICNYRQLQTGETVETSGIKVTAVPAFHPLSKDSVGFLVESERNVYFSGDTRFDWSIVGALRGKRIDVAILQVSCAFYTFLGGADGMDINNAVELAKAIRPKCVVPMHFDCIGKYLDIAAKKRVSVRTIDVEAVLERMKQKLSQEGIVCRVLYAGDTIDI